MNELILVPRKLKTNLRNEEERKSIHHFCLYFWGRNNRNRIAFFIATIRRISSRQVTLRQATIMYLLTFAFSIQFRSETENTGLELARTRFCRT